MSWWQISLIGAAPGTWLIVTSSIRRQDGLSWVAAAWRAATFVAVVLGAMFVFATGLSCLLHEALR